MLYQSDHCLVCLDPGSLSPYPRALRVCAIEDETSNPLRMKRCISNRRRAAFRASNQSELIEAKRIDDGLEVANERIDRERGAVPIRKAFAALVIVNEGMVLCELFGPVQP